MSLVIWKLFFNWLKSLWLPLLVCLSIFAIVKCFRIHSDNKLAGGGYIAEHFKHIGEDKELREEVLKAIRKTSDYYETKEKEISGEKYDLSEKSLPGTLPGDLKQKIND